MLNDLSAIKFAMVALNLLILYFFMRKFLFKPVTEFMENRTKSIKDSIDNAERNKNEAEKLKQKYSEQLRAAKDEADRILNEARIRADKEAEGIIAEAMRNSGVIIEKAREEIERERAQMIKDIKGQVAGLALAAASKVIEANMDTASNRALVEKFIDEAGAA